MTKVIAALDNSSAARPVLATALALADLLGAEVRPVHVTIDGDRIARAAAQAEGLELETLSGPVVERVIELGADDEVAALVLGARGTSAARRPLGSTALAVATALAKPLVVVPPEARSAGPLQRLLFPVEGETPSAVIPLEILPCVESEKVEIVVLHVHEEQTLPSFTDQPQHEHEAWAREFLRRNCPWNVGRVRFEVRVGRSEELVPRVAREEDVDLIALSWSQELGEGRARVVRSVLGRAKAPVLLVRAEGD
jgi:nucleotide-binding universal stress UspA family protein